MDGKRADAISQIVDFRSMAVVERDGVTERGLTQIKAIDEFYPLRDTNAVWQSF